jgi:predicted NBD/HSP70 family sugar kinase
MPKLNMTIPHNLTQDEALKRIKTLLNTVKTQFADTISNLHEEWDGNTGKFSFSAVKLAVSGTLTVNPSQVELAGNIPLAAVVFKGKIESTIKDQGKTLLA